MHVTPTLAAVPDPGPESAQQLAALVAIHVDLAEPPGTREIRAAGPDELIESLFEVTAEATELPLLAVREVIENLVHADFSDALVSVLDGGRTLRCADHGPGLADPDRAILPGFSTADARSRQIIRGVGSGLWLASRAMSEAGGTLSLEPNLGSGLVVTLSLPRTDRASEPDPVACSDEARAVLALLLEIGPAPAARLAAELERPISSCGRDLVLLESRGLVSRGVDGARSLTDPGARVVSTLF